MEILESQLSEVKNEKQQLVETLSEMKALVAAQNERLSSLEKIAANGEIKLASNTNVGSATIAQKLK